MKDFTNIEDEYPPRPGIYKVLIEGGSYRESQANWDGDEFSSLLLKDDEYITSWKALDPGF